jgi:hypothetical protein
MACVEDILQMFRENPENVNIDIFTLKQYIRKVRDETEAEFDFSLNHLFTVQKTLLKANQCKSEDLSEIEKEYDIAFAEYSSVYQRWMEIKLTLRLWYNLYENIK